MDKLRRSLYSEPMTEKSTVEGNLRTEIIDGEVSVEYE